MNQARNNLRNGAIARAFSLIEVLVVIAILGILIGFGVPAIGSILHDSEQSLAENQLRNAMSACRDAAVRSDRADAAAVFFFRADGRTVVVACQFAGNLEDAVNDGGQTPASNAMVIREVFTPIPEIAPVVLPKGWSVRGFAAPGEVTGNDPVSRTPPDGWYESLKNLAGRGLWVFPETNFVNTASTTPNFGWQRQTFMVRFKGSTGQVATGDDSKVIVVDPLNSSSFRGTSPYNIASVRFDVASDPALVARRLTRAPDIYSLISSRTDIQKLVGDTSPDTVLAGPVTDLALYQEKDLIAALRIGGSNNGTGGTPYKNPTAPGYTGPGLDPGLLPAGMSPDDATVHIGEWLTGSYVRTGDTGPVKTSARLFTVERTFGQLQEM
ncbi:MAG: prepilin-type N-terminal cleavage/methylation domain-containing protein [Tepidisphaera sp.]|nr:prepilin-type N-terminal cleavage/methylation domain-containing protein [Tepidisphaera sp.]